MTDRSIKMGELAKDLTVVRTELKTSSGTAEEASEQRDEAAAVEDSGDVGRRDPEVEGSAAHSGGVDDDEEALRSLWIPSRGTGRCQSMRLTTARRGDGRACVGRQAMGGEGGERCD